MNAQRARAEGKSYAQIAADQGVHPSSVYYALNPGKKSNAAGRQRSFYARNVVWDAVCEVAWGEHVSISSVVEDILTGRRPPIVMEEK